MYNSNSYCATKRYKQDITVSAMNVSHLNNKMNDDITALQNVWQMEQMFVVLFSFCCIKSDLTAPIKCAFFDTNSFLFFFHTKLITKTIQHFKKKQNGNYLWQTFFKNKCFVELFVLGFCRIETRKWNVRSNVYKIDSIGFESM